MAEFTFRTNSKLKTLVGQELITNNNIAIFELIKNSYDAGATKVEIEFHNFIHSNKGWESSDESSIKIVDNGIGMTTEEIDKYWMELGNSSKETNKILRINSDKMGLLIERFANGEKGIGRFGVDKIGSGLILESIGRNSPEKTTVIFDWNKYDDRSKLLQEKKNEYSVERVPISAGTGLKLTIRNLRDHWKQSDINKLKKDISKFLSPNPVESSEFEIFVSFYQKGNLIQRDKIENDSFNYLRCKISTHLEQDGTCSLSIFSDGDIEHHEEFSMFNGNSPIGKVFVEIYYLDRGDKSIFTRRVGIRPHEYGNVKVFKDNDWLEIDKKHAQGMFRTFGTRDIIGNVFLDGESLLKLGALKEATDRVGFIEDSEEFTTLKDFVWHNIRVLEQYVFYRIKKDTQAASEIVKEETSQLKKELNNSLTSFKNILEESEIIDVQKNDLLQKFKFTSEQLNKRADAIDRVTTEIDNKIKVYAQLSNKEGILYEMLHSIKNKLVTINNQIDFYMEIVKMKNLDIDLSILKSSYADIEKLVNGSLNKVNSSKLKKSNVRLTDILDDFIKQHQATFLQEEIIFEKEFDIQNISDIFIYCSIESMKTIFENLLNNSIKALRNTKKRRISIKVDVESSEVKIYFSDNGCGIPPEKASSIFTLWSSSTDGTGIGLASVKENLEDINGQIHLVDLHQEGIKTTFMMSLPRR